jgi:AraC family transcriptional regulator
MLMTRGFVYLKPTRIVFVRAKGPYETSVPAAWRQLVGWLARHGAERELRIGYGLARDDPDQVAAAECRFDACMEVPFGLEAQAAEEMATQKLPGGPYARHRLAGEVAHIAAAFRQQRARWAAAQGVTLDTRRPLVTLYLSHPLKSDGKVRCDLCTPVTSASDRVPTAA